MGEARDVRRRPPAGRAHRHRAARGRARAAQGRGPGADRRLHRPPPSGSPATPWRCTPTTPSRRRPGPTRPTSSAWCATAGPTGHPCLRAALRSAPARRCCPCWRSRCRTSPAATPPARTACSPASTRSAGTSRRSPGSASPTTAGPRATPARCRRTTWSTASATRGSSRASGAATRSTRSTSYVDRYAAAIQQHARRHRPALLHASSFHVNGLATRLAAARLGVPYVYEMRGLEDLMKVSRDPSFDGSDRRRFLDTVEGASCAGAERVFVITEALARDGRARGARGEAGGAAERRAHRAVPAARAGCRARGGRWACAARP